MGLVRSLLFMLTVMVLSPTIYGATQFLYFSDVTHCDLTYTVVRDALIQIEAKRTSEAGSSVYTDCSLLFRAENLEDKLCMKISTLTFYTNKLQLQYFTSLDPTVDTPNAAYDSNNGATTPAEICDNEYEISLRLQALRASTTLGDVSILIEVYNMQGTQRIAYLDTDCGLTYKLRDSTVFVQNTDPDGPSTHQPTCQLYFDYVGSDATHSICINYQKKMDTCGYELRVRDGPVIGSDLVHTYTCSNTEPQQWCGTLASLQLEMVVSGTDPLPIGVFTVEVKDAADKSGSGATEIQFLTLVASVMLYVCI